MAARCGRGCNSLSMHAWRTFFLNLGHGRLAAASCRMAELHVMWCPCVQREEQERSAQRLEQERLAALDRKKQEMVRGKLGTQLLHMPFMPFPFELPAPSSVQQCTAVWLYCQPRVASPACFALAGWPRGSASDVCCAPCCTAWHSCSLVRLLARHWPW